MLAVDPFRFAAGDATLYFSFSRNACSFDLLDDELMMVLCTACFYVAVMIWGDDGDLVYCFFFDALMMVMMMLLKQAGRHSAPVGPPPCLPAAARRSQLLPPARVRLREHDR